MPKYGFHEDVFDDSKIRSVIKEKYNKIRGKRIFVFENGESNCHYYQITINPSCFRFWGTVLGYITSVVKPKFGAVRRLLTRNGKSVVTCIEELKFNGKYVACGHEKYIKVKGGYRFRCMKPKVYVEHYRKEVDTPGLHECLDLARKKNRIVIHLFANGRSNQIPVKFVLTSQDLKDWTRILEHMAAMLDIPEGFQYLYTIAGNKICGPFEIQHGACYVAVPYNEKFTPRGYLSSYDNMVINTQKTGEAMRKRDIAVVSSPLGNMDKNYICYHTRGHEKPTRMHYERYEKELVPAPVKDHKQFVTSRLEEVHEKIIKLESVPSVMSYSSQLHKTVRKTDRGPSALQLPVDTNNEIPLDKSEKIVQGLPFSEKPSMSSMKKSVSSQTSKTVTILAESFEQMGLDDENRDHSTSTTEIEEVLVESQSEVDTAMRDFLNETIDTIYNGIPSKTVDDKDALLKSIEAQIDLIFERTDCQQITDLLLLEIMDEHFVSLLNNIGEKTASEEVLEALDKVTTMIHSTMEEAKEEILKQSRSAIFEGLKEQIMKAIKEADEDERTPNTLLTIINEHFAKVAESIARQRDGDPHCPCSDNTDG